MRRFGSGRSTLADGAAMRASRAGFVKPLLGLLALLATGLATAQPTLIVNGREIFGNTTGIVSGSSYAPAAALAPALGATLVIDAQRSLAVLDAAGRLMQVAIAESAAAATTATGALRLDGVAVPGPAGVTFEGEIYLPVKQVSEALGATITYIEGQNTVLVVQPRARVSGVRRFTGPERLEIYLSAPVRYTAFYNQPVNTLQIHFERTDVELRIDPVAGDLFLSAGVTAAGGGTDVRVQLTDGSAYTIYQVPDGRGFRLVVAFGAEGSTVLVADYDIVLDPGHGGSDAGLTIEGLGSESVLALNLAEQVASILRARGVRATLTRDTDFAVSMDRRSSAGVGADLFVSLHMADLEAGEFNAYYLSDAANVDSLQMAIRNNAQDAADAETDRLRRELLLGLVPDLALGRTMAEGISGRLFALGAYRGAIVAGAPLQVLGGAAGRGVLLEFSAADIVSPDLAQRLAQALLDQMESMTLGGR